MLTAMLKRGFPAEITGNGPFLTNEVRNWMKADPFLLFSSPDSLGTMGASGTTKMDRSLAATGPVKESTDVTLAAPLIHGGNGTTTFRRCRKR